MTLVRLASSPAVLPLLLTVLYFVTVGAQITAAQEAEVASQDVPIDYLRQVKPLLMAKCSRCHNEVEQEGSLRLDSVVELLRGGSSGPALIPGNAADSRLMLAVRQTGDLKMPPEGEPLKPEQIEILQRWIDQGAMSPADENLVSHWAYQKVERPAVPLSTSGSLSRNPVDDFVAAGYTQNQLKPLPEAEKLTLLRRVSLDLIGLPPTLEAQEAYLQDSSPLAYENAVDQLLESPRYGERWGRHWMDVWRYSDWDGYGAEVRESKPHIWRWRDWIVESLNADKPYDQMIVEMLAGDEVAPDDPKTLRATGYLVRNWYTFNRNVWLDNIIEHTGKAFMGVTFNCARCHNHMYDPMSQSEYYQLRAFFEPHDIRTDRVPGQADVTRDGLVRVYDANAATPTVLFVRGDEKTPLADKPLQPGVPKLFGIAAAEIQPIDLPAHVYNPGLQDFIIDEARVAARSELDKATGELIAAQKAGNVNPVVSGRVAVASAALVFTEARIAADQAAFANPPAENLHELALAAGAAERRLSVSQEMLKLVTAEQTLQAAKDALKPDDAKLAKAVSDAEAAVTAAKTALQTAEKAAGESSESYTRLTPVYPQKSTGRRLALARWIANAENPLTARVAVNHIWLRHFHQPLVPTVFDFGMNGKPASHPELLDWLASELVAGGWKMKSLHRLIVTSATYRLASSDSASATAAVTDPENRWLWRQNTRRMEAELIRDAALHLAGQLDPTMYGPDLDPASGLTAGRRSIYFRSSKEKRMAFLATFDSANPVECYQRAESISPQQSLAMSNSPLMLSQSRVIAGILSTQAGSMNVREDQGRFIDLAFRLILTRAATSAEHDECQKFLDQQRQQLADGSRLTAFSGSSESSVKPSAEASQRARENLIHVLLNHNDFVTIR